MKKKFSDLNALQKEAVVEAVYEEREHEVIKQLWKNARNKYEKANEALEEHTKDTNLYVQFHKDKVVFANDGNGLYYDERKREYRSQGWHFNTNGGENALHRIITPKPFDIPDIKIDIALDAFYCPDAYCRKPLEFYYTCKERDSGKAITGVSLGDVQKWAREEKVKIPSDVIACVRGYEKNCQKVFTEVYKKLVNNISEINAYYPKRDEIREYIEKNDMPVLYDETMKGLEKQDIRRMDCFLHKEFETYSDLNSAVREMYGKSLNAVGLEGANLIKGVSESSVLVPYMEKYKVEKKGEYVLVRMERLNQALDNRAKCDLFVFKEDFNRDSAAHFIQAFDKEREKGVTMLECVDHAVFKVNGAMDKLVGFYRKKFGEYDLHHAGSFEVKDGTDAYVSKAKEVKSGLYVLVRAEFDEQRPEKQKMDVFVIKNDFDGTSAGLFLKQFDERQKKEKERKRDAVVTAKDTKISVSAGKSGR